MKTIPITKEGYEKLKEELHQLKTVDRPKTIEAIEVARSHGDLSENAEYDAAKDRQSFIEGRIMDLEYKVANADVIDPSTLPSDKVVFASRFVLENVDTGEEVTYQLVGQEESDISEGRVSVSSPLGQAILGKAPGNEVTVQAPGGQRLYELVEIL
ncbi:transcription elongation factor GreA [Desulfoluna spongiiphila]|uniref:Transcription elongation factor GreA n=1 Tax=Desulfoluna spongiiphila TaxID=419481 RepID=A0A1G5FPH8_9BACT|nr:transcription elongation factor GreA [Desulfoluna spongiiphila]SCY41195.1 transcription elongation factor GreA [Desulfoluna spongiiphila]VVS95478.1 transcription elongation factor grea/greb [Desulfoluna spongiiphila]